MNRRAERSVELLERQLLHAARLERPNAAARRRVAVALAGGALVGSASTHAAAAVATAGGMKATGGTAVVAASGGVTSSAVAATATTSVGVVKVVTGAALFAGIGKAVAVGAISGAMVLGATRTLVPARWPEASSALPHTTAEAPAVSNLPSDLAHPTLRPPAALEPPARVHEIDTTPPKKAIGPKLAPTTLEETREQRAAPAPTPVDRAGEASPLGEEIAVIDRAREALMAGDSDRTLAIVDDYERTRTAPLLSAEAAVLRIEALFQRGERTRAAALASAFLRDHPESPVADRMRAIVDATSK